MTRRINEDLDLQGVYKIVNAPDAAGPQEFVTLEQLDARTPDPSGEPDGEWLMTSSGAAVWVPAAAALVPIADAGGYFISTDVEGALQELGASGGVIPDPAPEPDGEWLMTSAGAAVWVPAAASLVPITDAGGYFTSTDVEGALQELGAVPPGSGVPSVDGITGPVTLIAGSGISITDDDPSPGDITIAATGGGGSDGWVDDTAETWTYASFTAGPPAVGTFTVSGDVTTKYPVGTKIKLTQTTVKYFVVSVDPVFSGGNTTVTVTGGTDYTLANAAISANYHSYVANPQGYPAYFNFAPALTGWSGTPTVNTAIFSVNGRLCTVFIDVTGTSNATSAGGSLPIAATNVGSSCRGVATSVDNGANQSSPGSVFAVAGGSSFRFDKVFGASNGWTNSGTKGVRNGNVTYPI